MLNFANYTGVYIGTWSNLTDEDPANLSSSFERISGRANIKFTFNSGELFTGSNQEYEDLKDPSN